jgi:acyl-CoA hydrolase
MEYCHQSDILARFKKVAQTEQQRLHGLQVKSAMYVVTEYGMVNLKGKSVADRAQAMISLAHPDFRE